MEKASMCGKMEGSIRDSGRKIGLMVSELTLGPMEGSTRGSGRIIRSVGLASTFTRTISII